MPPDLDQLATGLQVAEVVVEVIPATLVEWVVVIMDHLLVVVMVPHQVDLHH